MSIMANGSVAQNRNGIGASSRRHSQRYGTRQELPTPFPLADKTRNTRLTFLSRGPGKDGNLAAARLDDMNAAARVHRSAFDDALPWLAGLHTPEEDALVLPRARVHRMRSLGCFRGRSARRHRGIPPDWIDQLYVLRAAQRGGIGTALLRVAQEAHDSLSLWTFQRNTPARRFYEARGFRPIRETDGADNEEKEPDALYLWTAIRVATAAGDRAARRARPGGWSRSWRKCCAGEHARCRSACRGAARHRRASRPRRAGTSPRLHGR